MGRGGMVAGTIQYCHRQLFEDKDSKGMLAFEITAING